MTFWTLTNRDFSTNQIFHQFYDLDNELDLHRILSGFYGKFATDVAWQQGLLTTPDTWFRPLCGGLHVLWLLRPVSPALHRFNDLPMLTFTELRGFHRAFATGVACQQGALTLLDILFLPLLGTCLCSNCWDQIPRTCHVSTRFFTLNTLWYFLDFTLLQSNDWQPSEHEQLLLYTFCQPIFLFLVKRKQCDL